MPLDRRDVVVEEVDPVTADHGDALELTVRFERREFPDGRPGTGGIVHRGSWKLIQQRADSLGHFRPRSPLDAVDGDDLERRGIAAHDDGDGVVALLGPVDADAVPRPGRDPARPARRGDPAGRASGVRDRPPGMCVPRSASNIRSTAGGSMARPSALGSWSSYSTAHIVRDSSACFRTTWSSVSHPWVRAFPDSTTRRRASPSRPPDAAWP